MFKGCDGFGSSFDMSFDRAERRFNFMWNFVMTGVIIVFAAVAIIWSLAIFGIF